MGGNGRRHRWFSFHHNSASDQPNNHRQTPSEFLCPISGLIMSDPVVVPSGQTFERISVQVCRNLGFVPELEDNTRPDFSTVIPNLTMKSTILSWCKRVGTENPRPPEYAYVEGVVRARMGSGPGIQGPVSSPSVMDGIQPVQSRFGNLNLSSSSVESVTVDPDLVAAPNNRAGGRDSSSSFSWSGSSYSSSGTTSGTDNPIQNPSSFSATNISPLKPISPEEEEVCEKLRSTDRVDNEQGLILLRKMTRSDEKARVSLCTDGILSFLRSMIISRYGQVQTNAAASLVNLSLEKRNKVKIVRSGFVPLLIDVLKSGTAEAQEHAAGSIFSLAVEEENKMVIGVLGALPPLLHALRAAESDRARYDAAHALYHLTSILSNQTKLIRNGAVPTLLSMIRSTGDAPPSSASSSGVLLILCNLAACPEGKAAMLEGNAVTILVGKLRDGGASEDSDMERENCVAALLNLSIGNLRFKGLAREAGAEVVLKEAVETGNEKVKEKAAKILQIMNAEAADGAGVQAREWEQMLAASGLSRVAYSSNF